MSQLANEEISQKISEIERQLNKIQNEKKSIEQQALLQQSSIKEQ